MNLTRSYTEQLKNLGDGFDSDEVTFGQGDLPMPAPTLEDPSLVIRVGEKGYHPSPDKIDWLIFSAPYESYKALGLALVASVFSQERLQIDLPNPQSDVRLLTVAPHEDTLLSGRYKVRPRAFDYFPTRHTGHSLQDIPPDVPSLFLVLKDEEGFIRPEEYKKRDTVFVSGSHASILFLAQTLLDMGNRAQVTDELNLERPFAFGGVGPLSAEVRIYTEKSEEYTGGTT